MALAAKGFSYEKKRESCVFLSPIDDRLLSTVCYRAISLPLTRSFHVVAIPSMCVMWVAVSSPML